MNHLVIPLLLDDNQQEKSLVCLLPQQFFSCSFEILQPQRRAYCAYKTTNWKFATIDRRWCAMLYCQSMIKPSNLNRQSIQSDLRMSSNTTIGIILVVVVVGVVGIMAGIYYCRERERTWPGASHPSHRSSRRSPPRVSHAPPNAHIVPPVVPLGNVLPRPAAQIIPAGVPIQPNAQAQIPSIPQASVLPRVPPPSPRHQPQGRHINLPPVQPPQRPMSPHRPS